MSNHHFKRITDLLLVEQRRGTISMDTLTTLTVALYAVSPDAQPDHGSSVAMLRMTRTIVWC